MHWLNQEILTKKLIVSLILGLNSGLSYALIGSTFTAYLHDYNVDLALIGLLSIRTIPYSFKYIWAPFIDNTSFSFFPKNFGQRKTWIITTQLLLIISILGISSLNPISNFKSVCVITFIIAFLAATYDIAMEAYRIELFEKDDLNRGSLANMLGFRIGLIASGAGGLYLSYFLGWSWVFVITAILIIPCMLMILSSKDERILEKTYKINNIKIWFEEYFIKPFMALFRVPNFYLIALTIASYKLSDNYLDTMLIPFLKEIGYSKTQIATIAKAIGIMASIFGTIIGSFLNVSGNMVRTLFIAEIFSSISNLLFINLLYSANNIYLLTFIVVVENLISGICNIVLINYMSLLCDKKFTATHYAILLSISGIFRTLLSSSSGWVATHYGWVDFFLISSVLSIPSLFFLYFLGKKLKFSGSQA
ncbi:MAG: AmpG family muropeptide MFS transporter [Alphaproteobacteria bacterium]